MLTKDQIMRVMLNQHSVPDVTGMPRQIDDKWLETKQVVVISGVRRCGKSYLLRQIRKRCAERDYYLRFDDDRLINFTIDDFETLGACFAEVYGLQHTYFFDEIHFLYESCYRTFNTIYAGDKFEIAFSPHISEYFVKFFE